MFFSLQAFKLVGVEMGLNRWCGRVQLTVAQLFHCAMPCLLGWVSIPRQHLEEVGQGSQGAASEWVPAGGGGITNCRTAVQPSPEPAQATDLVVRAHPKLGIKEALAILSHKGSTGKDCL